MDLEKWRDPTDAQKLSNRTIFRFQEFANLLKTDLNSLPEFENNLEAVLFAQRDWEHSSEKDGRFYKANLCATYNLTGGAVLEELKGALTSSNANNSITKSQLEALFSAHASVKNQASCFSEFSKNLAGTDKDKPLAQPHRDAHALLVGAASAIPYQGQLPTAFDLRLQDNSNDHTASGYWFTGTQAGFKYRSLTQLDTTHNGLSELEVRPLSFDAKLSGRTEELRTLFDSFLNPLLIGAMPNATVPAYSPTDFSGLAFPCYERTEAGQFAGSFLGWLFFKFSCKEAPRNFAAAWDPFRFAINHFASRILRAIVDELLGDYARDISEPDKAFAKYLPRFEGWIVGAESTSPSQPLALPKRAEQWLRLNIRPKWDTIHAADHALPDSLLLRCHRFHQGLVFVHENSQIESLRKYEQMLNLLAPPLNNLTRSLGEIQRDTQELRAVLYDPARTIFFSSAVLRELFSEHNEVQISPKIRIVTAHEPVRYSQERSFFEDKLQDAELSKGAGVICALEAACRIFGVQKELRRAEDLDEVRILAKKALKKAQIDSFQTLARDILWLAGISANEPLSVLANMPWSVCPTSSAQPEPTLQLFLENLKAVAFTPFKIDSDTWNPIAIELTLRPWISTIQYDGGGILGRVEFDSFAGRSPVPYSVLLEFIFSLATSKTGRSPVKCAICKTNERGTSKFCLDITFNAPFDVDNAELVKLRSLIDPILLDLRDWRIFGSAAGNWQAPFIDLANRALGLVRVQNDDDPSVGCWCKANHTESSVVALRNWRKEKFFIELRDVDQQGELRITWQ
jgi:hypothetical protein